MDINIMGITLMCKASKECQASVCCGVGVLKYVYLLQRRARALRRSMSSTAPVVVMANGWRMVKVHGSYLIDDSENPW